MVKLEESQITRAKVLGKGKITRGIRKALTRRELVGLTKAMCYAAGQDAGNRSMRAAGRVEWNEDDWNAAAAEFARLIRLVSNERYTKN